MEKYLDIVRELQNRHVRLLYYLKVVFLKRSAKAWKRPGENENQRKNHSILKIGQNTEEFPRRRLAVSKTKKKKKHLLKNPHEVK